MFQHYSVEIRRESSGYRPQQRGPPPNTGGVFISIRGRYSQKCGNTFSVFLGFCGTGYDVGYTVRMRIFFLMYYHVSL